jgi:cation:H+ antiporter
MVLLGCAVVTTQGEDLTNVHPNRQRLALAIAMAVAVPGFVLRFSNVHSSAAVAAFLFGLAIVGAAFLLAWAGEVAQLDISAGLAIALLAFVGVLPEYAVGFVFASKGGHDYHRFGAACQSVQHAADKAVPSCSLALANMTGANRLLIGVGWSLVVFLAWWRWRSRGERVRAITLERSHAVELSYLMVATLYSLTLPFKHSISLIDAAILVTLFVAYTIRISRAPAEKPHLVGPSRYIGTFSVRGRRIAYGAMFVYAAVLILLFAEHFADALVETGHVLGVSDFVLVQWLAPIASEAPELLVAGLYAWRLNTNAGLGTLVSSKVNQWTLLVGSLPLVFAVTSSSMHGMPITGQTREELLLTAAQSLFAVAILVNLSITNKEALGLFALFWAQFALGAVFHGGQERVIVSCVYLVLAVAILVKDRRYVGPLLRDGFRTPFHQLSGSD